MLNFKSNKKCLIKTMFNLNRLGVLDNFPRTVYKLKISKNIRFLVKFILKHFTQKKLNSLNVYVFSHFHKSFEILKIVSIVTFLHLMSKMDSSESNRLKNLRGNIIIHQQTREKKRMVKKNIRISRLSQRLGKCIFTTLELS